MFERYTERGRRAIFFARYESSLFGSQEITTEDLLLGILREDRTVASRLGMGAVGAIRSELEQLASPTAERVATSVDLPLSHELQRALAYAAEEAERLSHKHIDAIHLVLGLLRMEHSLAAKLLLQHGVTLEQARKIAAQAPPEGKAVEVPVNCERRRPEPVEPPETSLKPTIYALRQLVDNTYERLRGSADPSAKETLGGLINWAIVHHQWVTRAVMESRLHADGYPDEAAATVQNYADFPWQDALDLWVGLNRLLIHVLARVPEGKLQAPRRIGMAAPVPLAKLMEAYVEHCRIVVGHIRQE